MTTASASGWPRPNWEDRAVRIGHSAAGKIRATMLVLMLVPNVKPEPLWLTVVDWMLVPLMLAGVVSSLIHGNRLCEACIADFPLDAQEQAAKRDRTLRFMHWVINRRPVAGMSFSALAMVGPGMVATLALRDASLTVGSMHWPIAQPFIIGPIVALGWMADTHSRLRPACPYCRRRDGGGGESAPAPTPTPSMTR